MRRFIQHLIVLATVLSVVPGCGKKEENYIPEHTGENPFKKEKLTTSKPDTQQGVEKAKK